MIENEDGTEPTESTVLFDTFFLRPNEDLKEDLENNSVCDETGKQQQRLDEKTRENRQFNSE